MIQNFCCEVCELIKSKKISLLQDFMRRAKETLDIVHTDVLGKISPEAVHCCAIEFIVSVVS